MFQQVLNDLEDTSAIAKRIVDWLFPHILNRGISIALEGELGSGKTTLVAAIVTILKSGDEVSSPSYVLEHIYQSPMGIKVSHWDLYRLRVAAWPEELLEAVAPGELRLIEWPSKISQVLSSCDVLLTLEIVTETQRRIVIESIKNSDLKFFSDN